MIIPHSSKIAEIHVRTDGWLVAFLDEKKAMIQNDYTQYEVEHAEGAVGVQAILGYLQVLGCPFDLDFSSVMEGIHVYKRRH